MSERFRAEAGEGPLELPTSKPAIDGLTELEQANLYRGDIRGIVSRFTEIPPSEERNRMTSSLVVELERVFQLLEKQAESAEAEKNYPLTPAREELLDLYVVECLDNSDRIDLLLEKIRELENSS